MPTRNLDDWTLDRWRTEPPVRMLDFEVKEAEQNPPLWKDLAFASAIALVLWALAAAALR